MNEIKKTKTGTESGTETGKQPGIENGSPAKKPCSHIGLRGTATEQSAAGQKKSAEPERAAGCMPTPAPIKADSVPLSPIPQTISSEIHVSPPLFPAMPDCTEGLA
ncbi:hypothetical protein [Methanogenium sp. MK-MG]|uniref:hypothetical protein n=1 Tax=Methanogenium sp. MK-MG TaxID=2599926 RepID=UPI0013EB5C71|nr:hypothetical protein [Methanogenium sp. MK-MG]KAF1078276.1 hypothetical protein MKMG_00769 [Methanogenium sp. MK-MG]